MFRDRAILLKTIDQEDDFFGLKKTNKPLSIEKKIKLKLTNISVSLNLLIIKKQNEKKVRNNQKKL